jgi:hypothetical protein
MIVTKYLIGIDVKTAKPFTDPISVGVVVFNKEGVIIDSGLWRRGDVLDRAGHNDIEHAGVAHVFRRTPVSCADLTSLIFRFAEFYDKYMDDAVVIHGRDVWGVTRLFQLCAYNQLYNIRTMPRYFLGSSTAIHVTGEESLSTEKYIAKYDIKVSDAYGTEHNPLHDAVANCRAYIAIVSDIRYLIDSD